MLRPVLLPVPDLHASLQRQQIAVAKCVQTMQDLKSDKTDQAKHGAWENGPGNARPSAGSGLPLTFCSLCADPCIRLCPALSYRRICGWKTSTK